VDPARQAPVGDVWAAGLMSTAQRGQVSEKERVHYYILVYYLPVISNYAVSLILEPAY
jgi:hypothetical protein